MQKESRFVMNVLAVIFLLLLLWTVEKLLNSDYGGPSVVAIVIIYLLKNHKMAGFGAVVVWLAVTCNVVKMWALAGLIPLYFYHGNQGRRMKYFFYVFYPAHLLALKGIGHLFGV